MSPDPDPPISFSSFPDDVLLNILSFLLPTDIAAFACTSRRSAALCRPSAPLWLSLCHRRWGSSTQIRQWSSSPSPLLLYQTLDRSSPLIGFWRNAETLTPSLLFFQWNPSCITASYISPSPFASSYAVRKTPFLWIGLSPAGEARSYLRPDSSDAAPATISFVGSERFAVEESRRLCEEVVGLEGGSSPDRVMSEMYQYFANRMSSGAERLGRRWRRRKERGRLGRRRGLEAEHFVKISNCCPTPARPLQGLWKGISEDMSLKFYLVTYDDVGGIACWRVGDAAETFTNYSPEFWTSNTSFLESPFSKEEHDIYSMREHIGSVGSVCCNRDRGIVSRILCINCAYDLMLPDLADSFDDPRNVEGRIWEYEDGTFGFGYLRNNFIVDLKHIALDGHILDTVECSHQSSVL